MCAYPKMVTSWNLVYKLLLFHLVLLDHVPIRHAKATLEPSGVLELCPGGNITFVCANNETGVLVVQAFDQDHPDGEFLSFFKSSEVDMASRSIADFSVFLVSSSPSIIVTVTLTNYFHSQHNGTNLTCSNSVDPNVLPSQGDFALLTMKGPPSAPMSPVWELIPLSLTSAVLSWLPPNDSVCVTSYTITLNITKGNMSDNHNTTTNTTNVTVSDLTRGAEYFFTVAGVNAEGRVGEESVPSKAITLDTPEAVIILDYEQSYVGNGLERITLKWMPPPPSTRPPVIGYIVSYNSSETSEMKETHETQLYVEITVPNTLMLTVCAMNVLGKGEGNYTTISIEKQSASATEGKSTMNPSPTESTSTVKWSISEITTESTIMVGTTTAPNNNNLLYHVVLPCVAVIIILLLIAFILTSAICIKKSGWNCGFKRFGMTEGSVLSLTETHKKGDNNIYDSTEEAESTFRPLPPEPMNDLDEYNEDNTCDVLNPPLPPPHTEEENTYSQLSRPHKQPQLPPIWEDGTYSKLNLTTHFPGQGHNQRHQGTASTSHYVELGERSRDAPVVLPPEQTVTYTMVMPSGMNKGSSTRNIQHLSSRDFDQTRPAQDPEAIETRREVPPPLPPKGEPVHISHVMF